MRIADFALERYFAKHEFSTPHILCSSDIQGMAMRDLLALADDDARQRWDDLTLGYTETAGLPALRAEIASMYSGISPDDVLTFAGAEEAVYIAANVLLGPGDHMITTWPGYQSLYEVGRATGADVTLIEDEPRMALPEEFRNCAQLLQLMLERHGEALFPKPHRLGDADWVGFRLAERLPLPLSMRQQLLEMGDNLQRLTALQQLLTGIDPSSTAVR